MPKFKVENHELYEIILKKSRTVPKAAKEIGTTRQWLYKIIGGAKCSYALARDIETYSNYRIPAISLVETSYESLIEKRKSTERLSS